MKKYMLSEAFEKRLLEDGDFVDLTLLYLPLKRIVTRVSGCYRALDIKWLSEKGEWDESDRHPLTGRIYKKGGEIFVKVCTCRYVNLKKDVCNVIAENLLTDKNFNLIAQHNVSDIGETYFSILIGNEITVEFDNEDDYPILGLPIHTQYTV